jgi:hypothetical protein
MVFPRGRLWPVRALTALAPWLAFVACFWGAAGPRPAHAGKNDLQLANLCTPGSGGPCTGMRGDFTAPSLFRSMMSELGVVVAPRLMTPADTLGFSGFQVSAEIATTKINNAQPYWDGVAAVNQMQSRPDSYLTTVGGFVRKGMWLPLPAFELGAGALNVVGSNLIAVQGYAKLALQEGFHGWVLPSVAVRGSVSQLLGTDQVDLTVSGIDVVISKAFSVAGTARFEPFGGYNILFIDARSGVIDLSPGCDAYALQNSGSAAGSCNPADAGTPNDYQNNYTFARQDLITRQRVFAGFKMKLSVLFMAAEYDFVPAGRSRDGRTTGGALDASQRQQTFSLSAGFDF